MKKLKFKKMMGMGDASDCVTSAEMHLNDLFEDRHERAFVASTSGGYNSNRRSTGRPLSAIGSGRGGDTLFLPQLKTTRNMGRRLILDDHPRRQKLFQIGHYTDYVHPDFDEAEEMLHFEHDYSGGRHGGYMEPMMSQPRTTFRSSRQQYQPRPTSAIVGGGNKGIPVSALPQLGRNRVRPSLEELRREKERNIKMTRFHNTMQTLGGGDASEYYYDYAIDDFDEFFYDDSVGPQFTSFSGDGGYIPPGTHAIPTANPSFHCRPNTPRPSNVLTKANRAYLPQLRPIREARGSISGTSPAEPFRSRFRSKGATEVDVADLDDDWRNKRSSSVKQPRGRGANSNTIQTSTLPKSRAPVPTGRKVLSSTTVKQEAVKVPTSEPINKSDNNEGTEVKASASSTQVVPPSSPSQTADPPPDEPSLPEEVLFEGFVSLFVKIDVEYVEVGSGLLQIVDHKDKALNEVRLLNGQRKEVMQHYIYKWNRVDVVMSWKGKGTKGVAETSRERGTAVYACLWDGAASFSIFPEVDPTSAPDCQEFKIKLGEEEEAEKFSAAFMKSVDKAVEESVKKSHICWYLEQKRHYNNEDEEAEEDEV